MAVCGRGVARVDGRIVTFVIYYTVAGILRCVIAPNLNRNITMHLYGLALGWHPRLPLQSEVPVGLESTFLQNHRMEVPVRLNDNLANHLADA